MKLIRSVLVCLICLASLTSADDSIEEAVEGTWSRKVEFLGEIYKTVKVLKDGNETVSVYDGDGKLYQQWTVEYKVQTTNGINIFTYQNGKDTFGKYKGGTFNVDEPASYVFRIKDGKWYEATGMFLGATDGERGEVIVYERHHGSPIDAVKKASKEYDAALVAEDKEALKNIWDKEGTFVDHEGKAQDYDEMVAGMDGLKIEIGKSTDQEFRIVGESVLETGIYNATGTMKGEPFKWKHKYCDVWVQKDGHWVVSYEQVTPVVD